MWEGGGLHGSHEALLLQAAGSGAGDVHGHAPAWFGPAAAPSYSYMAPHAPPLPFGADAAAGPFGFGFGGYGGEGSGGGGGAAGQFGLFGLEPPPGHGMAAPAPPHHGYHGPSSSRVVSGLLGTLQAELGRMTAKEIMDAKALAASRSHSEAERRRRQRINGHLAKLRSLLPNTTKTDKASLLAEVIEHVKELKRQTSVVLDCRDGEAPATQQQQQLLLLPTESDELAVEAAEDGEGRLVVRASLCCEDRAGLIPDIARALAALRLRARRAEIATLGGRVRNVLLITADEEDDEEGQAGDEGGGDGGAERGEDGDEDGCAGAAASHHRRHELVASVQEALRGVMDRKGGASSGGETSSSSGGGGGSASLKRQRMSQGSL
ncbi:hypothetical protein EJB05_48938, partial [Eragrostis curvula]